MRSSLIVDDLESIVIRHRFLVVSLAYECVKDIDKRHDPCFKRDLLAPKVIGIAASVILLMVVMGNIGSDGNEFLVVLENCSNDKMEKFAAELEKEIALYNKTSGGYEIRIAVSKVLNETAGVTDFRELVAKLYGNSKV